MKKTLIITLLLAVVFVGCSNDNVVVENDNVVNAENDIRNEYMSGEKVVGEIQKIIGNQLTIKEIKMPEMSAEMEKEREEARAKMIGNGNGAMQGMGNFSRVRNEEPEYTGNVIEVIIPVGVEIKNKGRDGELIEIGELTDGMLINIFIDSEVEDSNYKYATYVKVVR